MTLALYASFWSLIFTVSFQYLLQHDLQGHISDVNTCKFFPSGKVVLSGGADLRLKIWSAEDGSCPVTLKGHTGGEAFHYALMQI